jgi:hypothetical protein
MLEYEPSPFERLAAAAGLSYWQLREHLEREIMRRRRERYAMHRHAHEQLDQRLARIAEPD